MNLPSGSHELVALQLHDGADVRQFVGGLGDHRQIARGAVGIVICEGREAVRIDEVRVLQTQRLCTFIHFLGECGHAAGVVARERLRDVIGAFHHHRR
jgi:hypothetical protein